MSDRIRIVPCFDSKNFYDLLLVTSSDIDRAEYLAWTYMCKVLGLSMTTWDLVRYQGFTASPELSWVGRVMTVVYLQGGNQSIVQLRQADVVGHFKNPLSSLLVIGTDKSKTAKGLVANSDGALKSYPFGASISGTFAGGMQNLDWLMYVSSKGKLSRSLFLCKTTTHKYIGTTSWENPSKEMFLWKLLVFTTVKLVCVDRCVAFYVAAETMQVRVV